MVHLEAESKISWWVDTESQVIVGTKFWIHRDYTPSTRIVVLSYRMSTNWRKAKTLP